MACRDVRVTRHSSLHILPEPVRNALCDLAVAASRYSAFAGNQGLTGDQGLTQNDMLPRAEEKAESEVRPRVRRQMTAYVADTLCRIYTGSTATIHTAP